MGTHTMYGLASRLPFARIYPFLTNQYLLIVLSILDLQPYVQFMGQKFYGFVSFYSSK